MHLLYATQKLLLLLSYRAGGFPHRTNRYVILASTCPKFGFVWPSSLSPLVANLLCLDLPCLTALDSIVHHLDPFLWRPSNAASISSFTFVWRHPTLSHIHHLSSLSSLNFTPLPPDGLLIQHDFLASRLLSKVPTFWPSPHTLLIYSLFALSTHPTNAPAVRTTNTTLFPVLLCARSLRQYTFLTHQASLAIVPFWLWGVETWLEVFSKNKSKNLQILHFEINNKC